MTWDQEETKRDLSRTIPIVATVIDCLSGYHIIKIKLIGKHLVDGPMVFYDVSS